MNDKVKRASEALSKGQTERARRLLAQILRLEPNDTQALWVMARLQESRGEAESWLETLTKLTQLLPEELGVLDELARAYAKLKRLPESVSVYEGYLTRHPDSVNARYNYAYYLSRAGQYEEAVKQYELLLSQKVEKPEEIYLNLAKILSERFHKHEVGREYLEKALSSNSLYAPAWFNLGNLNEQFGDLAEAKSCFEKVIDIADDGGALARIADLTRFDSDPDHQLIEQMQEKLAQGRNPNPDLMFSLGRAYEQIGEHKRSLELYESANIIDWQYLPIYNKDLMTKLVERIVEEYSAQEENKSIREDLGQVFICGNFRSGSTLLEQMLAAHSNFAAGGERDYFRKIATDVTTNFPFARSLGEELKIRIAEEYDRETLAQFGSRVRVTDKRPDNLVLIGLIKQVLPQAKIIITQRDPLDVAWSIFTTRFGPDLPYATRMENILHYMELQEELAAHWSKVFKGDVIFVSYEKLVSNPKEELMKLLDKLGEPWEDSCLDFQELKNFVTTASSAQVRRSLNDRSVGRAVPFNEYIRNGVKEGNSLFETN